MPIGTTFRHPVLIAALAAAIVFAMVPLGAALDVHHLLAAADRDGHQHSDFDLCQWVQHHETTSPALQVFDFGRPWERSVGKADPSALPLPDGDPFFHPSPRGPPLS